MAGSNAHENTVVVSGLRDLLAEIDKADRKTKRLLRDDLRRAAEPVRQYAEMAMAPIDLRTARNFRTTVRKTGVISVEQRLRRTTGKRPDFGRLQMRRALVPGLVREQPRVVRSLTDAVEQIAKEINTVG